MENRVDRLESIITEFLGGGSSTKNIEKSFGQFMRVFTQYWMDNPDDTKIEKLRKKLTDEVWMDIRRLSK